MRLILVRHTRPAVAEDVCYGAMDLDVAPTFEEEAARVIEALPPADKLVTSPLRRCRLLAQRIGAARSLVPVIDARLREVDFGTWEGVPWASIPRTELDAWAVDFFHARPHGGESVDMLRERVRAAMSDYRRSGLSHVVVTHAGVIKAARVQSGEPEGWKSNVDFGEIARLPGKCTDSTRRRGREGCGRVTRSPPPAPPRRR